MKKMKVCVSIRSSMLRDLSVIEVITEHQAGPLWQNSHLQQKPSIKQVKTHTFADWASVLTTNQTTLRKSHKAH